MISAWAIEAKPTAFGDQEEKKGIVVVLDKKGGSNIKPMILKVSKASHLHPEEVLMTMFPRVLSKLLTMTGFRTLTQSLH